jgi:hypothetical protein
VEPQSSTTWLLGGAGSGAVDAEAALGLAFTALAAFPIALTKSTGIRP